MPWLYCTLTIRFLTSLRHSASLLHQLLGCVLYVLVEFPMPLIQLLTVYYLGFLQLEIDCKFLILLQEHLSKGRVKKLVLVISS